MAMNDLENAFILLSEFAYGLRYENISAQDREWIRLLIADYYAAVMAGYRINTNLNVPLRTLVMDMGGREESTVAFSERLLPASSAALLYGCYARGAEMDDGHRKANAHVYSTIMPAVFALAETLDVTEEEVLTAVAVGYEFVLRLSNATMPGQRTRGFHPTCMAGAIGSAVACAKLMGLPLNQYYTVIAAAALQANGIMVSQTMGPLGAGKAAQTGVLTARLVAKGVCGDQNERKSCAKWFTAVSDTFRTSEITDGLGEKLCLSTGYIKLYPACRHIHGAIDAALALREEVDPLKAERIIISLYGKAMKLAGGNLHPRNSVEAKFSAAYAVSCALVNGRFSLDDLNVECANPQVGQLSEKLEFVLDDTLENLEAGIRGTKIEILADGVSREKMIPNPKGDSENPVTLREIRGKMSECAGGLLDEAALDRIFARVTALDGNKKYQAIQILQNCDL